MSKLFDWRKTWFPLHHRKGVRQKVNLKEEIPSVTLLQSVPSISLLASVVSQSNSVWQIFIFVFANTSPNICICIRICPFFVHPNTFVLVFALFIQTEYIRICIHLFCQPEYICICIRPFYSNWIYSYLYSPFFVNPNIFLFIFVKKNLIKS